MSRYTDVEIGEMIAMTGWDTEVLLSLYANFIAGRGLEEAFTDFCRAQAEHEMSNDERMEDYEAECETAGGPVCPQCHVVYAGIHSQSHKLYCGIGQSDLKKYVEQIPRTGSYYERVRLYAFAIEELEEDA